MTTKMVLLILFVSLALTLQHSQARPGPVTVEQTSPGNAAEVHGIGVPASSTEIKIEISANGEKKVEAPLETADTTSAQDESENGVNSGGEVVCTEMGTCVEKRLLTATIDYQEDGPNNPITDPPH